MCKHMYRKEKGGKEEKRRIARAIERKSQANTKSEAFIEIFVVLFPPLSINKYQDRCLDLFLSHNDYILLLLHTLSLSLSFSLSLSLSLSLSFRSVNVTWRSSPPRSPSALIYLTLCLLCILAHIIHSYSSSIGSSTTK
jgi:hypothetical protein